MRKGRLEFLFMLSIRAATVNDVALLKALIFELAEYERKRDQVVISEADLVRDGFGPQPKFRALIAEWGGQAAGYALFFGFYSTWEGRPGLFLEDLFVRQTFRGKGIGKALLANVAGIAKRENCYGVRWGSARLESTGDRLLQEAGRYIPRSVEIRAADGRRAGARGRSELTPTSQRSLKTRTFHTNCFGTSVRVCVWRCGRGLRGRWRFCLRRGEKRSG